MGEGRTPSALALSFTHIFQMDFVKRPKERIVIADCFTASTVLIRFTGGPKKMWVRIRAEAQGSSGSGRDNKAGSWSINWLPASCLVEMGQSRIPRPSNPIKECTTGLVDVFVF